MAHLIDKSALVAEIERLREEKGTFYASDVLYNLEDFLDTLEVKEVDLKKEIASQYESNYEDYLTYEEFADIAKHFFELGLLSTITEEDCKLIWNISDKIPCMREEEFFKELLKRYKAQKGE